ncbi:DUF2285 domain-containing protein [Blastochloris sulfoviridis]|uniref:DUF2285 domain-containing protein n=2 Tax=Blastochloris sulfoviridis TaxID=50712 RepID=A0A5M6I1U6_9HYPH|nr:DUF2285 domain-containing protein [Blastochloris sulfoviridis]
MIHDGTVDHQLLVVGVLDAATPMAAIIPLDDTAPQRAEAAVRFWRFVGRARPPTPSRPVRRRDRLIAALRALDGRLAGASYRIIAEALFEPRHLASEPWKTSSVRDSVIRLVRTGYDMMRGDYRRLLGLRRSD